MSEDQDLAPVVENNEPIVQEEEEVEERAADIEKPKKQKRPYIMTEARKSAFERMKQLRADTLAAKRASKDQVVEKNEEEQPPKPRPAPSAPKEKKQYKPRAPRKQKTVVMEEEPSPVPPVTITWV